MRLILIRHGETQSNVDHLLDCAHPGAPLNETGLQQARDLVDTIAHEDIDALYVSTLTRAQQTAEPLAAARSLEATVLDGVHEITAGEHEMSEDWTAYVNVLSAWPTDLDARLEGAESGREFLERFNRSIAQVEADGHERAAVVTHGAAMRVWSLFMDPEWGLDHAPVLANTQWIVLEGTSQDGWTIQTWADQTGEHRR